MVHTLDEQVGAIVAELKKRGVEDNTLILFTSDNGPSYAGGADPEFFQGAGPFDSRYGRGKGFLYEGGIRVPFIAVWPGHIPAGSESGHVAALWDIFPTLQEIARVPQQAGLDGLSLLPVFKGRRKAPVHPWLYWEFPEYGGQQALRMGKWKALRLEMQKGNLETLLFNLEEDPREQRNIAAEHPDVVAQMERIMAGEHQRSPIARFRIRALDEAGE
jgi:arylsulfatase